MKLHCVEADCSSVLLGDQEVGSPRPQTGDGVVWLPWRRLSITSSATNRGRDSAAEEGLLLQWLAVRWPEVCVRVCVCQHHLEFIQLFSPQTATAI